MTTTEAQRERLAARLSTEQKRLIEHAAAIQGLSLTAFVVQSAEAAAEAVIRDHQVISLSAQDSLVFAEAILNPPEPNEALKRALRLASELSRDA